MQSNEMDAVQTLEDLTWGLINVDAPSWFICEKGFATDWDLSRHKATPRHIKKENDLTLS